MEYVIEQNVDYFFELVKKLEKVTLQDVVFSYSTNSVVFFSTPEASGRIVRRSNGRAVIVVTSCSGRESDVVNKVLNCINTLCQLREIWQDIT